MVAHLDGKKTPGRIVKRENSSLTIRASEVGTYLFCQRAWWYQRQGAHQDSTAALESGLAWHRRHGRRVLTAGILRLAGWALLLLAAASAAAFLAPLVLG